MNRENIIRMAREANRYASNQTGDSYDWQEIRDERFADLVAAAEREACAKVCDELAEKDRLSNYYAVAAKAIRARGNT